MDIRNKLIEFTKKWGRQIEVRISEQMHMANIASEKDSMVRLVLMLHPEHSTLEYYHMTHNGQICAFQETPWDCEPKPEHKDYKEFIEKHRITSEMIDDASMILTAFN